MRWKCNLVSSVSWSQPYHSGMVCTQLLPGLVCSTHLHGFDGLGIHPYGHPLHGNVLKHFIYTWDGSVIQSEVALCLNHIIVVWFVPSCYSGLATSIHLYCFDRLVEIHPYGHPLHGKVLNHFIYIWDGSVIQSEVVLGLNHVIVVLFDPSCCPGSANSTHLHGFDGIEIHPYGNPLHGKVLKHITYTWDGSVIQSEVAFCLNHIIVVWFVPSCYPGLVSSTHLHGFDGLGIHPYGHPLHQKVLKHCIYKRWKCNPDWSGSWPWPRHIGIVWSHLLPRFSQLSPPQWLWWSIDTSKWPFIAWEFV